MNAQLFYDIKLFFILSCEMQKKKLFLKNFENWDILISESVIYDFNRDIQLNKTTYFQFLNLITIKFELIHYEVNFMADMSINKKNLI